MRSQKTSQKTRPPLGRKKAAPENPRTRPAARTRQPRPTEKEPPPLLADTKLGPTAPLSVKQKCHLRGLGHHLEPVVHIGKGGITAALCEAAWAALWRHELIKLRVLESAQLERYDAAAELATRLGAVIVQVLGETVLLYRRRPTNELPHITLL